MCPVRYAIQISRCRQLIRAAAVGLNGLLAHDTEQLTFSEQAVSSAGHSPQKFVFERLPSDIWDQAVLMPQPLQTQAQKLSEAEQAACQLAATLISQTAFSKAIQADQDVQIQVSHSDTAFLMARTYFVCVAGARQQQYVCSGCVWPELLAAKAATEQHVQQLQSAGQSHVEALRIAVEQLTNRTHQLELQHESALAKAQAESDEQLRQLQVGHEDAVAGIKVEHDKDVQQLVKKLSAFDIQGAKQLTASSDAQECSEGLLPTASGLVHQSSEQAATNDGMLAPLTGEEAASAPAAPKHQSGLSSRKATGGAPQTTPTSSCHQQQQAATPKPVNNPQQPQDRTTAMGSEVQPLAAALPSPEDAIGVYYPHQDLADCSVGLQKRIHRDLAEDDLPTQSKLFKDDGTMVEGGTELLAALQAKYTRHVERANAAYQAAQRQYLLLTNKDAKSAIPSDIDQLRSHTPGTLAAPPTKQTFSLATSKARLGRGKMFAEIMAEANSVLEDSKRQNAVLAELRPYRELEKVHEERAKRRMQGLSETQALLAGGLQSAEATKAAYEKMQADRIAAKSSKGPRARAQEQLSALEASLSRVSPSMYNNEAYKKALRACQEAYSVGLASSLPQQSGLAGVSTSPQTPESSAYKREAMGHHPALCARQAELVRATLDNWKAGKVPSLADALREQLRCGPGFAHLSRPRRHTEAAASTSLAHHLQGPPSRPAQPLVTGLELQHQDPPDDLCHLYDSPPLGRPEPVLRSTPAHRPTMLPIKARVNSRPGRGAMPLPISVHPQARPFGVTQSTLAIREAAQLRARDPTAKHLRTYRLPSTRTERASRLEHPLEGLEMPDQLSSSDIGPNLLAQGKGFPQHASTSASAAVLAMDAAEAGTSADHISGYAVCNPGAKAKAPATPQVKAATPAVATAPQADAAQPVTSTAQASAVHILSAAAAPAASLPADLATPPAVTPQDAAGPSFPAGLPATNTEAAGLQHSKALTQRPGQKQRKKLRAMADLAKAEDSAKAVAEAEAKAEAKVKATQAAAKEAAKAEAAAATAAEAQRKEEARVKQAAEEKAKAAAARLEAKATAQTAARKKRTKAGKKKARGAALQLPAVAEDQLGWPNPAVLVAAAAPHAAPALQHQAPADAVTAEAKPKKEKTQPAGMQVGTASSASPPMQTHSPDGGADGKTDCAPLGSHTATPSCPTPASDGAPIQADLETPGPSFFGPVTKLVSPGWDAVARRKAIAEAEARGRVWDGKFTMIPMPNNPQIRTLDRSKMRVVGRGASGVVSYGEGIIGGVVVALAVKLIECGSPEDVAYVQQEVDALKAVCGKQHILQYVQHTFTPDMSLAFLTTRGFHKVSNAGPPMIYSLYEMGCSLTKCTRHTTRVANHRFEEGKCLDAVVQQLAVNAREEPQLRQQHVLTVKKAFCHILKGVQGLHACGRAHVDLKPENLFIRDWQDLSRLHCSVHDLGGSLHRFAGVQDATCSIPYVSPQMLHNLWTGENQPAVDLLANDAWALGVILVQMLTAFAMFGVNFEDGPDMLKHNHEPGFQAQLAACKHSEWVSF
ncbi:cAMP-dependent protein kinase catalytic subunit [Trebouxia sp. C0009 RCD-2024]